jgi:Holliday junction resolvase RusA-like endonuclease
VSRVLVTFTALLDHKPLPRPALASGRGGQQYYKNGDEYQAYKRTLRMACEAALPEFWSPYDGPVAVRALVQFDEANRPKVRSNETWHMKPPDEDNLLKPIQDSMTGLVFTDDRTAVVGRVAKIWGPENLVVCRVIALDLDPECGLPEHIASTRERAIWAAGVHGAIV